MLAFEYVRLLGKLYDQLAAKELKSGFFFDGE